MLGKHSHTHNRFHTHTLRSKKKRNRILCIVTITQEYPCYISMWFQGNTATQTHTFARINYITAPPISPVSIIVVCALSLTRLIRKCRHCFYMYIETIIYYRVISLVHITINFVKITNYSLKKYENLSRLCSYFHSSVLYYTNDVSLQPD